MPQSQTFGTYKIKEADELQPTAAFGNSGLTAKAQRHIFTQL
jgi:hypothetical protein